MSGDYQPVTGLQAAFNKDMVSLYDSDIYLATMGLVGINDKDGLAILHRNYRQ